MTDAAVLLAHYVRLYAIALASVFAGSLTANILLGSNTSIYASRLLGPLLRVSKAPKSLPSILVISFLDSRAFHAALATQLGVLSCSNVIACSFLIASFSMFPMII